MDTAAALLVLVESTHDSHELEDMLLTDWRWMDALSSSTLEGRTLGKAQCAPMLSMLIAVLVVVLARESRVTVHVAVWTLEPFILRLLSMKLEDSLDPLHVLLLIRL